MEWAFVPLTNITLDIEATVPLSLPFGTLKEYQSSPEVIRYHCHTCSASVFYRTEEQPSLVRVAVGLMESPGGARAESWLEWMTSRLDRDGDALCRAGDLTAAVDRGLAEYSDKNAGVSQVDQ